MLNFPSKSGKVKESLKIVTKTSNMYDAFWHIEVGKMLELFV